ncbi:MAG: hypothetical protein IBV53_09400 [Candidatus Atribacteria bacterium]
MRNLNPKIVLILDEERVVFMCKICGKVWSPKVLKDGRLSRGSWQCPNGCKPKESKES